MPVLASRRYRGHSADFSVVAAVARRSCVAAAIPTRGGEVGDAGSRITSSSAKAGLDL